MVPWVDDLHAIEWTSEQLRSLIPSLFQVLPIPRGQRNFALLAVTSVSRKPTRVGTVVLEAQPHERALVWNSDFESRHHNTIVRHLSATVKSIEGYAVLDGARAWDSRSQRVPSPDLLLPEPHYWVSRIDSTSGAWVHLTEGYSASWPPDNSGIVCNGPEPSGRRVGLVTRRDLLSTACLQRLSLLHLLFLGLALLSLLLFTLALGY